MEAFLLRHHCIPQRGRCKYPSGILKAGFLYHISIASWVEQLVQKKLHQAYYNRNKQMEDDNLLGSEPHNDNHVQGVTSVVPVAQTQDNEEVRLTGFLRSKIDYNV